MIADVAVAWALGYACGADVNGAANDGEFSEGDHPRDADGKFIAGGGSGNESRPTPSRAEQLYGGSAANAPYFLCRDEKPKFVTLKTGQVVAFKKGGELVGAGHQVGPDKLPALSVFRKEHPELEGKPLHRQALAYIRQVLQPRLNRSTERFANMPKERQTIVITGATAREMVQRFNPSKAMILPFIPEVVRSGKYVCPGRASETKYQGHGRSKQEKVFFLIKDVKIRKRTYSVNLVLKRHAQDTVFLRDVRLYAIGTADRR